jgi:ATP-dependent exoDNAse (exonuclease V) beta subunit
MITEKYNYRALTRKQVDGKRLYSTPDGNAVPSVTTILDKTKSEEKKQALRNWKKRVGEAKAQEIVTEAAGRGTRMHKWLEDYCLTDVINSPGSNPFSQQSHRMAQVVIDQGLCNVNEYWGMEVPLYFPQIYAGTTDCVGLHNGTPAIMDFKQSNKPKKEEWIDDYKLQMCAYAEAHNEVYGSNIRKGVVLMCVKPDTNEMGQIITDPVYQEFVIEGDDFDHWRKQWWMRVEQYYLSM